MASSRLNPKEKFRSEEDKMDELLKAAGLYEDGLSFEMKKSYLSMLDESRSNAQNQSFQEVLDADTQEHAVSQSSGSPVAKVARIAINEKENGENQVKTASQDTRKSSSQTDMFDDLEANDVEVVKCMSSPFHDTIEEPASDSEKETDTSTHHTSVLCIQSDTEDVVVKDRINRGSEPASIQVIQADLFENEDSSESFKSTKDVLVSNSPVYEPESTKTRLSKFYMPTYDYLRTQEYKDVLRVNILGHKTQDEPQSFYEILLSEKPKMKHRRCPFYFDGSVERNKQHNVIRTELRKNSLLLRQLHYEQNYPDFTKWAQPIRANNSIETLDSMDKYVSAEPKECIILPWGQKPCVLDWKKGKDVAPKKFFTSGSNTLSLSRAQKMLQAVTGNAVTVSIQHSEASTSRTFENTDPERRSARPMKTTYLEESSDDDDDDVIPADKSDDSDWLTVKSARSKGKGGARGRNTVADGTGRGGKTNEGNRGARGGRGRAGKGSRGRGAPPVASVQPHLLRRNQKDKTEDPQEAMHHPASELMQCPICSAHFTTHEIQNHAANCGSNSASDAENETGKSCPRCSTFVPASEMEKHDLKCEQKHRAAILRGQPSTSGQRNESQDAASRSQIVEDWSTDNEMDDAIIQRPRKRRRTNNGVGNES